LAAILHVYAGGSEFYEVKKRYFSKRKWKYFDTSNHYFSKSIQKQQIAQITQYDP